MSPSYPYPYPRAPLFPKTRIQTLQKIYPSHRIPIAPFISLYPNTTSEFEIDFFCGKFLAGVTINEREANDDPKDGAIHLHV